MKRPAEDESEGPSSSKVSKTLGARVMQGQGDDKKHSLDSDEEEGTPEDEGTWMSSNNEGEEAETLRADGDIPITPFNLNEEKSEGDFTKDGDFVWKKKDDGLADSWLESLDWASIHEKSSAEEQRKKVEDDREDELEAGYDEMGSYAQILELLKPGESVAGALRRLGGSKKGGGKKKARPWEKNKNTSEELEAKANKELMLKLSGLADSILSRSGNMEVYEETFEGISFKLKSRPAAKETEEAAMDMFASDEKPIGEPESNGSQKGGSLEEVVNWEFKWEDKEDAEVHGPHSSQEMYDWQESGFFENGVFVRKVDSASSFGSSRRIDFELYT